MEKIVSYLRRNIKLAVKSIFFHYKQYLCFFVAVFIIQIFYGTVTISAYNNDLIEYRKVDEEYDYHLVIKGLDQYQYIYLLNDEYTVFKSDHIHDIIRVDEHDYLSIGYKTYDVYIKFLGNESSSYSIFKQRYFGELAAMNDDMTISYSTTPLLNFKNNLAANNRVFILFTVILLLLSFFLLTTLYNIRINHYKFTYGIYMTFGADFKKLFESAFWEMFCVTVITFIPSVLAATAAEYFIYLNYGEIFSISAFPYLKTFLFSLVVSAASVVYPVWRLSRHMPMSLILAQDNSNLVISPRRSFDLSSVKFPIKYEKFSLWRFRKYVAQLLLSAVIFSALFVAGIFFSSMYKENTEIIQPEFTLGFTEDGQGFDWDGEMNSDLLEFDNVISVEKATSTKALSLNSHILVNKSYVKPFSNLVIDPNNRAMRAINSVKYHPADADIVEMLSSYDIEGDPSLLLTDENAIVLSDTFMNKATFTYKPGDTITVASYNGRLKVADDYLSGKALLRSQLESFHFIYKEYTIAAVIHNIATDENLDIYFCNNTYSALTGKNIDYKTAYIFVNPEATHEELSELESNITEWIGYYENIKLTNNHAMSLADIEQSKNYYPMFQLICRLIFMISPLIWFFSQIIFYLKRENEFIVLNYIGAVRSEIKQLFSRDAVFYAVGGTILYFLLSFIITYVVYLVANYAAALINVTVSVASLRFSYTIPTAVIIAGLAMTVLCGYLSCMIPYLLFKAKNKQENSNNKVESQN